MMRYAIAMLLLGGCVQNPPPSGPPGMTEAQAGSGSGSDMECHEETPTGSMVAREVCRPKAVGDNKDEDGIMRGMQTPGPSGGGAHGPGQ